MDKYLKDKKEFEKHVKFLELGPGDESYIWEWVKSHDRKMLEWVLKEATNELVMMTHGYPNTADIEYCQGFRDAKEKTIEFLRQLINQKIKN